MNKMFTLLKVIFIFISISALGQNTIIGTVVVDGEPLPFANVYITSLNKGTTTDDDGNFSLTNIPNGSFTISASYTGFSKESEKITLEGKVKKVDFVLTEDNSLGEVVISGTLKPVIRIESPVPVEVYTPTFLKKNPTPSIFDALQNVNGVRPQLNCNVCNTGDIHINGLEGPYTLVLIDGMPIVSGLSTVY